MSGMDIPIGENLKKEKNIPNIGEKRLKVVQMNF